MIHFEFSRMTYWFLGFLEILVRMSFAHRLYTVSENGLDLSDLDDPRKKIGQGASSFGF